MKGLGRARQREGRQREGRRAINTRHWLRSAPRFIAAPRSMALAKIAQSTKESCLKTDVLPVQQAEHSHPQPYLNPLSFA